MGAPMATRLFKAGFPVFVFDAKAGLADKFASETGAAAAASLPELMRSAELIITMLRTSADVGDVLMGAGSSIQRGSTVIDMTSGSPHVTRAIAGEMASRGISMLDAPVSGGIKGARDGALTIMVGGAEEEFRRWTPVLQVFGAKTFYVGAIGAGQAIKALNNLVSAAGLTAAAEAVLIGKRFGLDPAQMIDIINVSSGRNHSTENKFKSAILPGTYDGGFAFDLMLKDISIALDLAEQTGTTAPLGRACVEMWGRAKRELGPGADSTEIARWLESAAP